MKQTLEKLNELINSIDNLNENEQVFICNYLEDLSRDYRHHNEMSLNLLELYNSSKSENLNDFAYFLLKKA
jgi:hypothetical protein